MNQRLWICPWAHGGWPSEDLLPLLAAVKGDEGGPENMKWARNGWEWE